MQPPRQRFHDEETMARSHQRGTVRLEHKSWVGYLNLKVLDPTSGESKWKKQRVGVLGAKSEMTKYQAYDKLERIIAQKTGGTTEPRADESIVTLGWFTRNRFFPLRLFLPARLIEWGVRFPFSEKMLFMGQWRFPIRDGLIKR